MVVLGATELRPDEVTRANPKIFANTPRVRHRKRLLAEIGKTASDLIFCWEKPNGQGAPLQGLLALHVTVALKSAFQQSS